MHLMKKVPKEHHLMTPTVPPIKKETSNQETQQTLQRRRNLTKELQPRMLAQPGHPGHIANFTYGQCKPKEQNCTRKPPIGLFLRNSWENPFQDKEHQSKGANKAVDLKLKNHASCLSYGTTVKVVAGSHIQCIALQGRPF